MPAKIKKIEVSPLFWKDLADWRKLPEYPKIRANIGAFVAAITRGESGGEMGFRGVKMWEDIKHLHVGSKLVLFTKTTDEDTIRICALKKHDFYGFKRERKSMAGNAVGVILRAAVADPKPSPDWGKISWSDPSDIHAHPELRELSRDALDALYQEVAEEGETFEKLDRATSGMSEKNALRVADAWLGDLLRAEKEIQDAILFRARLRNDRTPASTFTSWVPAEP